ncbi:MAG: hypothetical protein ABJ327_06125 [Litoreibacter sp.]
MSMISSVTLPVVTHLGPTQPSNIPPPDQKVDTEAAHYRGETRTDKNRLEQPNDTHDVHRAELGSPTTTIPVGETYPSNTASHTATNRLEPASRLSAESKIAVITQTFSALEDAQPNPIRLASERAQELAVAREVAEKYRQSKAREEIRETSGRLSEAERGNSPRETRITPIDEIPDRPIPQAGVQVL